jgi:hypothetical protein
MAVEQNSNYGQIPTQFQAEQELRDLKTQTKQDKPVDGKPISVDPKITAGTPKTGPDYKPSNMSYLQKDMARINGFMVDSYRPDANKYNKLTTYNSSHYGQNFERYHSHNKFKQLGFSPFRNNEDFYNKNSSLWDDAGRAGSTALRLAGLGFASTFTNWGSFLSDKPNTEEAEEMDRLMSIGSSSREGFGAKALNFGVNAGYTYGVMSEILAEEAALFLAGTFGALPSGGTTTAAAIARTGTNIGRAYKALKLLTKADDARQLWKAAKTVGGVAREWMPLSQTTSLLTQSGKAAAKWDSLDDMAKVSKTFGSFYRDLREINAVTSEAKLEGGTVQNEVTNQLMAEYRKKNGKDPDLNEAKNIAAQARKAGYLTSQANIAGIYVSNKIVLDRALKGLPGLKNLETAATRGKATFLFNKNWKAAAQDPYTMVRGAKKFLKGAYYKQAFNPKNLGKGGLNYLSANLMEGTQEVYQEAVGKGITDYFINTYNNPNLAGSAYFRTMMESGLKSQASGQGLETFLSGFLMAGPMTMAQSGLYKGYDAVRMRQLKSKAQKFTADPANAGKENPYQKQIDAELEFDQKTLEAMNEVTKDPTKYFNALEKDLKIQRDLAIAGEQAALDGDEKFARDTRDASLIEHSIHLLNAGRFDVFQDQIKGLGSLSKEELQEAFGEDPAAEKGAIQERLQKVIARTNEIKDVYEQYQNTTNPYSLRDQPEDYLAFEQMRNVMISDDIHFKFVANRMTGVYDSLVNSLPFANASMADFAPLFSVGDPGSNIAVMKPGMRSEIELLSKEIEGLGDRPENAERKASLTKKRDNLQQLSGLSQLFLAQYKVTQSVAQNEELFEENNRALEETEAKFKNAFFNHMRILAEQSGEVVLDKDIQKAYDLYRDYWKLAGDKAIYANAINTFADPKMFAQMRARMSNAMKAAMGVRQEKLKESLAEYKKRYLTNNFFNDLFEKFNAFVDPDEAQAFLDDKEVPTKFYNAETLEEISFGDEAYKGILALIDEYDQAYFEETGKRFVKSAEGTVASFREKDKNDKRALNDLATEFGFSPTAETTSVNSRQVLQAIIDSDFADKDMKKLAQRLLATVGADEQIMFKMNHHTNSTFDPTNGIIVDPRFSAEGYNIGIVPIEFSILNAMMQKMTSDALTSDKAFNDAITNLRSKLSEAATDAIEKRLFSLALSDNQGFIAEVMTSPLLQQRLASIPYTETLTEQTEEAKTLWGSFIDEIKKMLERVFGAARAASVYDEAITVITNKLSQPGVAPSGMSVDEIETDEETVTEEDPALEELLKKGFEEALASMAPEDRVGMQFSSWKLTSPIAADIIKKYNAEKIKQAVGKQETGSVPVLTEEERKRQMTELGYTVAELNSMTEDVVNDIISNRIKKKITIARKTADIEVEFDAFLPAEDIVENAIDDLKRKLREANYKVFETRDATGKVIDSWYARADVRGDEIPGTRHERVSNVVKGKDDFAPGAADRGTVIDELLRDYLSGQLSNITDFKTAYNRLKVQYPSAIFSDQMLEELFDKFRTVERQIKSLGLRVDARIPTLFGVLGPKIGTDGKPVDVAGSIDILAFNSLGQVYIIDLKTSTQDRRLHYKAEEELEKIFGSEWESVKDVIKLSDNDLYLAEDRLNPDQKEKLKTFTENPAFEALATRGKFKVFFYKSDDIAQQNAYRELLKQVSGIEAKGIVIFPLITRKTGKTYTSVEFQKDENDKYTIHVPGPGKMDIYNVTGRENVITQYPDNPLSADKIEEVTGVTLSEAGAAPAQTEEQPTEETNEEKVAKLRAQEREDLRKAIPNIDEYRDTEGNVDKSKLSPLEVQMYNEIYEKYDKLISPLLGIQPKTGTQTQMDFEELTLKVGDRVKVDTPKDGEGIIKEDRGDKVLLEDGRQVMKKSLTKLTQQSAAPKSIVTPELQGKVIYVTPSKESTEKLIDIPGVVYGNTILAKYVMGDFNNDLINRIRTVAESDSDLAPYAQTVVNAFENGVTKDMFGREDLTKNLLYSITALETANWKEVKIEPIITIGIKAVLTNAWSKVMAEARTQADQGATVVFDNNDAAASNKVDIAFVGETDITQKFTKSGRYKYETALKALNKAIIKDMPSGKSIVDILQGNAEPDIQVSKAVQELAVSLFQATKAEFEAIKIQLDTLKSLGVLDSVLQKQNLTADAVEKMMATKEQKLKELLDIDDINVGDVVEFNEKGTNFPGMVIAKVGGKVTVAKVILNENGVPTQSKDDLFNSKEISTFTAREVPYNIFPMADQKPVVPTPDVKAQTDAAMQNQTDNQGDNIAQLNEDLEANKDKSAGDVLNDFLNNINCKG